MSDKAKKNDDSAEGAEKNAPEVSREARRALFESYEAKSDKASKLEVELKAAKEDLSEHIRVLCETLGSFGPFSYKGKQLMASHKGSTWFFKSHKTKAEVID
jgi:hypothetical protein